MLVFKVQGVLYILVILHLQGAYHGHLAPWKHSHLVFKVQGVYLGHLAGGRGVCLWEDQEPQGHGVHDQRALTKPTGSLFTETQTALKQFFDLFPWIFWRTRKYCGLILCLISGDSDSSTSSMTFHQNPVATLSLIVPCFCFLVHFGRFWDHF